MTKHAAIAALVAGFLFICGVKAEELGPGTPAPPSTAQAPASVTNDYKLNCQKPANSDEVAACEQKRAADIAQRAYDLSWWQAVMSVVGLFAVLSSLWFSGKAAKAAQQSAEAALDSVDVQRKIGQATVRAYLAPTKAEFQLVGNELRVNVWVDNKGQSPAQTVRIEWGVRTKLKWGIGAAAQLESPASYVPEERVRAGHIAPAESRLISLTASTDDLAEDLRHRMHTNGFYIVIQIRVYWKDIFDEPHYSTFEFAEYPEENPGIDLRQRGNNSEKLFIRQLRMPSILREPIERNPDP